MKVPNKKKQIGFNHSSDIDFEDFGNLYKKCTAKPYSILVIDVTLASDTPFTFQKGSFRKNIKPIDETEMKNCNTIFDINREATKIPALSFAKITI